MRKLSRKDWQKHLDEWAASGESMAAYCRRTGLNAKSMSWWKWRLGSESSEGGSSGRRRKAKAERPTSTPLALIELEPSLNEGIGDLGETEVTVREVVIRVPAVFSDAAVERALAVLESRK